MELFGSAASSRVEPRRAILGASNEMSCHVRCLTRLTAIRERTLV